MIHRPPNTGNWKLISYFIVGCIAIIILFVAIDIIAQKSDEQTIRKSKGKGILVEKKYLRRGNFLIVLQDSDRKIEYSLAGFDLFYDKLLIGDSLVKRKDAFTFDVYRKTYQSAYSFIYNIGY